MTVQTSKVATQPEPAKTQHLTVVVRIRPAFGNEQHKGIIAHKLDEKMVLLSDPSAGDPMDVLRAKRVQDKKYLFDWAFDGLSTQDKVYDKTTKHLVENVLEGYNGTVFAYGATGSGKTYTMVGTDHSPGIMVRALKHLFVEVDKEHSSFEVNMSYLEIYNEAIRDLLISSSNGLDLREDAKGNHQVVGLTETKIASSEQVMALLTRGNKQRTQEATGANRTSSRSHAMLLVRVQKRTSGGKKQQQIRTGCLYMVDLAGSERAANTQNTGKRFTEGAHINKSLLALGNCINALAEKHVRYVNFRDSKLTRLLKEPLTGNCRTVMVAHVSPAAGHFEESRNTLVYADRAKNITTKLRSNVSDVSYHVAQYQSIISELRNEIQSLREKIRDRGADSISISSSTSTDPNSELSVEKRLSESEMKELKEKLIESFNNQMEMRRRIMEIDSTLLGQSIEYDKINMVLNEWETEKAVTAMDAENQLVEQQEDEDDQADMPDHVRQAWEDLQFLRTQQQRYLQMREDCQEDYENCRENTHKATESLPDKKASTQEQRELLHLLARVYELEVEKMELQASQLVRDHELRYRDLMLKRYDRQRQLCDDIITRQRQLIDAMASTCNDKDGVGDAARKELNELYRIYQQEISELSNGRDSGHGNQKPSSANGLRPLGTSGSMLELYQVKQQSGSSENPLPPIAQNDQDDQWLFRRRKPPPPVQQQSMPQNDVSGRQSDMSDVSISSRQSLDSPRILPPLQKTETPPSPAKYVNTKRASNIKQNHTNHTNNRVSFQASKKSLSMSSQSTTSSEKKFIPKDRNDVNALPNGGEKWRGPDSDIWGGKVNPNEDSSRVELRRPDHRYLHRRYGLLPSLAPSRSEPPILYQFRPYQPLHQNPKKAITSSDSEEISPYRQREPDRRHLYQNQAIERTNRGSRSHSFDRTSRYGYPYR